MTRFRLIAISLAVFVVGAIAMVVYHTREPRYQNRSLSEWIDRGTLAYRNSPAKYQSDPDWLAASHAVKQIGTNAYPLLIKWMTARDSRPKAVIAGWVNSHPAFHFRVRTASEHRKTVRDAFALLGDEDKFAWPLLIGLTRHPNPEYRLAGLKHLLYLHASKPILLPVLLRLMNDSDPNVKTLASRIFEANFYDPKAPGEEIILGLLLQLDNATGEFPTLPP